MKFAPAACAAFLALAACATTQTAPPVTSAPRSDGGLATGAAPADTAERLLAAHNAERARVGAAPLVWDAQLAASAAAYGPQLARIGRLQHSPRADRPGVAENLMRIGAGPFTPEQMVGSWIEERQWFRPGPFPNNSTTGNWLDTSHYTQLIWPTTTRVGCAIHPAPRWTYLICHYAPKGNQDGVVLPG